ncbi:MAG: hypothetical protein JWO33_1167 [Caulobacteraceae bacterium]|nr:hypothetical protein [Caulobacteraceae bacterium]
MRTPICGALIGLTLAGAAQAAEPARAAVLGSWRTNTDAGVVEIRPCGQTICGALRTSEKIKADPQLPDRRNKDPRKRQRPLQGLTILTGFNPSADGWTGGEIYDPESGSTYDAALKVVNGTLVVKGCLAPLLCRSERWRRID